MSAEEFEGNLILSPARPGSTAYSACSAAPPAPGMHAELPSSIYVTWLLPLFNITTLLNIH